MVMPALYHHKHKYVRKEVEHGVKMISQEIFASKKGESEGKKCALYDTSLDENYQSKASFFETI